MAVLEERGLFWWADAKIMAGDLTPDDYVAGLLTIQNDGRITLELDGYLPSEHGPMVAVVNYEVPEDKCIRGLLKASNKQVLLLGLQRRGGQFRSHGISHERYVVWNCLVSESATLPSANLRIKRMNISLEGFEEWLRLRGIKFHRTKRQFSAKYKKVKDIVYRIDNGKLSIRTLIAGTIPFSNNGAEVIWKEQAEISFHMQKSIDMEAAKLRHRLLEDALILLTDSTYRVDWPSISTGKNLWYRLYYPRMEVDTVVEPPKFYECPTNFLQLRDMFGSIWSTWSKSWEEIGAGVSLYLATRRSSKLYAEHQFVNLVWGIEAFHRHKYVTTSSSALEEKIRRIIEKITVPKDKKWLSKKLKNAHEPSLGERIFETLEALPLSLEAERLRAFSDECAGLRNDISHFGGRRSKDLSYQDFLQNLIEKSDALSILYHLLLLCEIGVDSKILYWWVFDGFKSYRIKSSFVRAGLLHPDVLKSSDQGYASAEKE